MPEQLLQTETQPSLTALVAGIINDVQQLIRQELALAKSEAKQEWDKTKSAAASFGAAAVVGVLGVIHVSLMLVFLLQWLTLPAGAAAAGLPLWVCFGIIGGLFLVVGAILFYAGKNKAEQIHVVPPQTAETMKENVEWIKNQT